MQSLVMGGNFAGPLLVILTYRTDIIIPGNIMLAPSLYARLSTTAKWSLLTPFHSISNNGVSELMYTYYMYSPFYFGAPVVSPGKRMCETKTSIVVPSKAPGLTIPSMFRALRIHTAKYV